VSDPRGVDADRVRSIQAGTMPFRKVLSSFCPGGMLPIVMIGESPLLGATATDGRILPDRVLSGFGVRLNAHKRTFLIAASVCRLSVLRDAGSLALDERRWSQGKGDGDDNHHPQPNN
jgi:hypothetical protein